MTIRPIVAWYDIWVGFFWDQGKRRLYILPIPCIGIVIQFARHSRKRLQMMDLLTTLSVHGGCTGLEILSQSKTFNGWSRRGTMYMLLYEMEELGWLASAVSTQPDHQVPGGRAMRVYRITEVGQAELDAHQEAAG